MIIAQNKPYTEEEILKLKNKNKVILASLASGLKRVSLALQRNSYAMANRFSTEALKRKKQKTLSFIAPLFKITCYTNSSDSVHWGI